MIARGITEAMVQEIIDTGDVRHKDATRLWIAKYYQIETTIYSAQR